MSAQADIRRNALQPRLRVGGYLKDSGSKVITMRMYTDLAPWWRWVSQPEDYADEAAFVHALLQAHSHPPAQTVLELGSGGGNNASHLKAHYRLTLVDLSPQMLDVSQQLNPECEHLVGDMRTVRLERLFDAVFIHDAIDFMTTEADLRAALATAYIHCRPGGVTILTPDHVRETFQPRTSIRAFTMPIRAKTYVMAGI